MSKDRATSAHIVGAACSATIALDPLVVRCFQAAA